MVYPSRQLHAHKGHKHVATPERLDGVDPEASISQEPDQIGFAARLHLVTERFLLVHNLLIRKMPTLVVQIQRHQHVLGPRNFGESLFGHNECSAGNQAIINLAADFVPVSFRQEL
jgi:hypothetical protein